MRLSNDLYNVGSADKKVAASKYPLYASSVTLDVTKEVLGEDRKVRLLGDSRNHYIGIYLKLPSGLCL